MRRDVQASVLSVDVTEDAPLLVGQGPALCGLVQRIATAAAHARPVLVVGEAGSGKTLVARAVHARSDRRALPFVVVSCAAHATPVLEEMLFAADRGGPGEIVAAGGAFRRARGGSVLLRDLPELDAGLQSRVLDEMTGGAPESPRVLATCEGGPGSSWSALWRDTPLGRSMEFEVIQVPPLRDRIEDLPLLVGHFAGRVAQGMGVRAPEVLADGLERLRRSPWPGNVRELANAVERAMILRPAGPLDGAAFAAALVGGSPPRPARKPRDLNLAHLEHVAIAAALKTTSGHQGRAARLLGISPRTLRRRLRERTAPGDASAAARSGSAARPVRAMDDSAGAS